MPEAERLWGACIQILATRIPESIAKAWLEPAIALEIDGERLVLAVTSLMAKERIESRWVEDIESVVTQVSGGHPYGITVVVREDLARRVPVFDDVIAHSDVDPVQAAEDGDFAPGPSGPLSGIPGPSGPLSGIPGPSARQAITESPGFPALVDIALNPDYTFEHFVIGASNRFSHAAALSVAETPAKSYNPLFIYGDAGLGKTHLLHAIGHYVRHNYPGHVVRYVSTEAFLNDFIDAIRTNTQSRFKQRYRQCDVLLVDDVQLIENKERFQEEFFHTIDFLRQSGRQVVISSDRPPKAMSTLEERLRSRFSWGLITDLLPPDLETRLAILRKKTVDDPTPINDDVLNYIAASITNNIRELEGALHRVLAYTSLNGEVLTLAKAEPLLNDIISASEPRPVTGKLILNTTADMFGFSVEDLCGKSRSRPLVIARQIGMYVFRHMTDFSYPAIGREFGGRDHTTVIHAVEKISALMRERSTIYEQVQELMQRIRAGG